MSAFSNIFSQIANAIRSKLGVSTTYKPSQMAGAINSINNDIFVLTAVHDNIVINVFFMSRMQMTQLESLSTNPTTVYCKWSTKITVVYNSEQSKWQIQFDNDGVNKNDVRDKLFHTQNGTLYYDEKGSWGMFNSYPLSIVGTVPLVD